MRLTRPRHRRIRIQILQLEGNKAVPGTHRNLYIWDATTAEVFAVVKATLEAHAADVEVNEAKEPR